MDMNSPVLLSLKVRGCILIVYQSFAVLIYLVDQPILPIIICIILLIISGFLANLVKYIIIRIKINYVVKNVIKQVIIEESENCCICLDPIVKDSKESELNCKHIFHTECIRIWYEHQQTCPLCRFEIKRNRNQEINNTNNLDNLHDIEIDMPM